MATACMPRTGESAVLENVADADQPWKDPEEITLVA